jgi:hypothetical protein
MLMDTVVAGAGSLCAGLQNLVASTQAETLVAQAKHGVATDAGAALVRPLLLSQHISHLQILKMMYPQQTVL